MIDNGFAAGVKPEYRKKEVEENTEEGEDYDAITEEHRLNAMDSGENDNVESGSSAKNVDFDKWLDDYEEYYGTLLKYYKKIQNGDQSAYVDYMRALQKFNSLSEKLHGAENEMTPAQTLRLSRIMQKFSQEIQQ